MIGLGLPVLAAMNRLTKPFIGRDFAPNRPDPAYDL